LVDVSTATEDAMARQHRDGYDIVITDMSRPPDPHAGYTLLDALRARGDRTPVVIYAGSITSTQAADARNRGAWGSTDQPHVLYDLVVAAVRAGNPRGTGSEADVVAVLPFGTRAAAPVWRTWARGWPTCWPPRSRTSRDFERWTRAR
jgi:DNA-binding NtrC family response regulator